MQDLKQSLHYLSERLFTIVLDIDHLQGRQYAGDFAEVLSNIKTEAERAVAELNRLRQGAIYSF